jgi:hypothetical protein
MKSLLSLALLATPALAGELPTRDEVASVIPKEVCLQMSIEVTRLADRHAYTPVSFPLCVEVPGLEPHGNCRVVQDPGGNVTMVACDVVPRDPAQRYLKIKTPGYEFDAYFNGFQGNPYIAHTFWTPTQFENLTLFLDFQVDDVWSLRLSRIVEAHKAQLPVDFVSLILPAASGANTWFGGVTTLPASGQPSAFELQQHGPNIFGSVQALGYDQAGVEYGVHIGTKYDSVSF